MPKKKSETRISVSPTKTYEDYLQGLDLFVLALENASCSLNRLLYNKLHKYPARGLRNITAKYSVQLFDADHFDIAADYSLTVNDKETKESALKIQCCFRSHYHGKTPLSREYTDRFANAEFRFVVWPYFRQYVFDLTGKMFISPITIPLQAELKD